MHVRQSHNATCKIFALSPSMQVACREDLYWMTIHSGGLTALKQPRSEAASTAGGASPSVDVRAQTAARKTMTELYVALACASIKGALSHLNMPCNVIGNSDHRSCMYEPPSPLKCNRS